MRRNAWLGWVAVACTVVVLSGCSIFDIQRSYYREDLRARPQEGVMKFRSKQDLAKAATLMNKIGAEAYYKGLEPESEKGMVLYDLSFAFLDLAGVIMGVDPNNMEDVTKVLEGATKALEEKDAIIHQLQVDVNEFSRENKKIVKDKEAELKALNGKWQIRMGSFWWWVKAVIIGGILVVIVLGIIQAWTGIPILTAVFGGAKMVFKTAKQTVRGINEVKKELKAMKVNGNKEEAERFEALLHNSLDKYQDGDVKRWVEKERAKL